MFRKEQTRSLGKFILHLMNASTLFTIFTFVLLITLLLSVIIKPLAQLGAQILAHSILKEMNSPGFLKELNINSLANLTNRTPSINGWKDSIEREENVFLQIPMLGSDDVPSDDGPSDDGAKEGHMKIHMFDIIVEIKGEEIYRSRNLLKAGVEGEDAMNEQEGWIHYFNRPYSAPLLDSAHTKIGSVTTRIYPSVLILSFAVISILIIILGMVCLVVNYLLSRWLIAPIIRPLTQLKDQFQKLADGKISELFEKGLQMDKSYLEIKQIADQAGRIIDNTQMYLEQLRDQNDELEAQKDELQFYATTDGLTGLLNRRYFLDMVRKRMLEPHTQVALILFDIDDFKRINDKYSHIAGDEVLEAFSLILQKAYDYGALVGRFGGEEFAVFLADMEQHQSLELAEHLRLLIESESIRLSTGNQISLTASIGVVHTVSNGIQIEELYQHADRALYLSKEMGKNRITLGEIPFI